MLVYSESETVEHISRDNFAAEFMGAVVVRAFKAACENDQFAIAEWLYGVYDTEGIRQQKFDYFSEACEQGNLEIVKFF